MATKKEIASVLAFEKKLVPSDAYFYGTNWDNRENETPLKLQEKSVRGTISNRLKGKDIAKLDAEIEDPNLQTVDSCALEETQDTLKHVFTLKILGGIDNPSTCNNAAFKQSYQTAVKNYLERTKFTELGYRYAQNIANARFLWRNRLGAEKIEVLVSVANSENSRTWKFDAKQISTKDFDNKNGAFAKEIAELGDVIAKILSSSNDNLLLNITTYALVGCAQEVYPSEELVLNKEINNKKNKKGSKSKILYQINGVAGMHSQKVGNAIRSIDTWYDEYKDETQSVGAIAIEPYGAVTNLGKAFRNPNGKKDFFTLFDNWARGGKISLEEEHYVMAVLVRGGVFGESEKNDK